MGSKGKQKILGYKELFDGDTLVRVTQKTIMKNAVKNIVKCISSGAVPACTGIDGVKSLEIICAFHASALGGNAPVELPLKRRDVTIKSK